jgi:hypothetical protein
MVTIFRLQRYIHLHISYIYICVCMFTQGGLRHPPTMQGRTSKPIWMFEYLNLLCVWICFVLCMYLNTSFFLTWTRQCPWSLMIGSLLLYAWKMDHIADEELLVHRGGNRISASWSDLGFVCVLIEILCLYAWKMDAYSWPRTTRTRRRRSMGVSRSCRRCAPTTSRPRDW